MMRMWTQAEEAWLAENYHAGTINDTLDAFEREFGHRHSRSATYNKANELGLRKDRHDNERRYRAQARMRWSEPAFAEMREWMVDQWDSGDVGESEVQRVFRVLAERCFRVAMDQYWVSSVANELKAIVIDECPFLFLAGYMAGKRSLKTCARILADEKPLLSPLADNMRKALEWARLHEEDGWEPDDGMAAFLAEARSALAEEGGE